MKLSGCLPLIFPLFAAFGACPDWMKHPDLPLCPSKETIVLPELYPIAAHVIGATPASGSLDETDPDFAELAEYDKKLGPTYAATYVENVLRHSEDYTPMFFLPVSKEHFLQIKNQISSIKDISKDKKDRWLASLHHVEIPTGTHGDEVTWQRDGILSQMNGTTGGVEIRRIFDHPGSARLSLTLAATMHKTCPLLTPGSDIASVRAKGPGPLDLPPGIEVNLSPFFGGNILGMPGSLCAHGSNQPENYVSQYCEKAENGIPLDVDWLHVGHVDEMVSLVKTKGKAPCDFALIMPSPIEALKLMKANRADSFFDFGEENKIPRSQKIQWLKHAGLRSLCDLVRNEYKKKTDANQQPGDAHETKTLRTKQLSCEKLTNGDVAAAIEGNPDWLNYQELVNATLEESKNKLLLALKARLFCTPEVIFVPSIYFGGTPKKTGAGWALPSEKAKSIHPNLVNSVSLGNAVLIPNPRNKTFRDYYSRELEQRGIPHSYLETWDFAHRSGNGNLHCSTFTVPYCRKQPLPKKSLEY